MISSYLLFLRYCINDNDDPSHIDIDWSKMMVWAESQALIGVVFQGIERVGPLIKIPFEPLMEWIGQANYVKIRNKVVNNCCVKLAEQLVSDGFDYCILKGQGNALWYPSPLLRSPGDIDVWVRTKNGSGLNKNIRDIVCYVKKNFSSNYICYHHVDCGLYNGVKIEIHFRPSYSFNPIYNKRLQNWFLLNVDSQFCNKEILQDNLFKLCVPTGDFNLIFLLSHLFRHYLIDRLSLKQVIDYFYLIKSREINYYKNSYFLINNQLKYLGLYNFACALMWLLNNVFGLEEDYLFAPLDEKRGRKLLDDINTAKFEKTSYVSQSFLRNNIMISKRIIPLMFFYPSECLWEPFFRIFNYLWRIKYNHFIKYSK